MTRLRRLAAIYLSQTAERIADVRFDVVSVMPQRAGAAVIEHLVAAF